MTKSKGRHVLYLLIALAMLVYGLPKLQFSAPWDWTSVFGMIWIGFALVVIAAHLNVLLLINEEKRRELDRIKRAKNRAWEQRLEKVISGRRARG